MTFTVIPLFMLMSAFIAFSDIGKEAYEMSRAWLGQLRGGLAMATVGACGIFAACTGTSMAGAIAMGKIAYPEMKRYGYEAKLSLGTIAAGATLGILIPPSMGFILIGILDPDFHRQTIYSRYFPGNLTNNFICHIDFYHLPDQTQLGTGRPQNEPSNKKLASVRLTWPVILLFLLIMGGMYGGIFSATEAGAIGAFGALVIASGQETNDPLHLF